MFQSLWNSLTSANNKLPLIYSLLLITLIPLTLVVNTWWNLQAFERDMDYAVRDKALAIQKTFSALLQDQSSSEESLKKALSRMKSLDQTLIQASVLTTASDSKFRIQATSDDRYNLKDENLMLNQLAWAQSESYFTKSYDSNTSQNVWIVVSPLYDTNNQKIGLVNFKVNTKEVDEVIDRSSRDALIILGVSVLGVVLLLINHLRLFEQSMLVEKLQQIDKMKDDFISVASHEIRTPLTAIKSCVSLIREDFKDKIPADLSEWFAIIDGSVARLNDLVNDLLNVSRIEQNRLDFNLTSIDTSLIITEIIDQLRFPAKDKGLKLIYDTPKVPLLVLANADRLREVLINLIGNAIKYTQKGSVTIKELVEKDTVKILVQDTGIGIAPEDQEKLFQKFYRVRNNQTQEIPGTGLGLWITKAIIEKMKGKIYIDSIVGEGTVFTVILKTATSKQP